MTSEILFQDFAPACLTDLKPYCNILRVFIVGESQGEKCPFHLGQGKSGKLAIVRGE